jgi:hypothetical protein
LSFPVLHTNVLTLIEEVTKEWSTEAPILHVKAEEEDPRVVLLPLSARYARREEKSRRRGMFL